MLSNAGIRSLSMSNQFYLYSSNYWRGAVWINVNYLILRGLYKYYLDVGNQEDRVSMEIKNGRELY